MFGPLGPRLDASRQAGLRACFWSLYLDGVQAGSLLSPAETTDVQVRIPVTVATS